MKKSTSRKAILILIGIAIADIGLAVVPVAAIIAIVLIIYKPKWLLRFIKNLYDEDSADTIQ
jgi:hypothetical protein